MLQSRCQGRQRHGRRHDGEPSQGGEAETEQNQPRRRRHHQTTRLSKKGLRYARVVTTKATVEMTSWGPKVEIPTSLSDAIRTTHVVTTVVNKVENAYLRLSESCQSSAFTDDNNVFHNAIERSLGPNRMDRSPSPALRRLGETTFRYETLSCSHHEIRLLKILPETTSYIKCELIRAPLDNPPSYVALSYAWGDTEDTRAITLQGHQFPITLSLWYALARLRSRDGPVVVWADAVCINQKDNNERNHQVQSMTGIYAMATSVAIWLGPESEDSDLAVKLLENIVQHCEKDKLGIRDLIYSSVYSRHFFALVALFERSYWYRLWVIQELHNARVADVYCGKSKLPWTTYLKASIYLSRYQTDLIRAFPCSDMCGRAVQGFVSDKGQALPLALVKAGPAKLASENIDLLSALDYHREKLCCDPRDRVFGILGILSGQEQAHFVVDYTVSVRELYIDVVDYLLTTTHRLDAICYSIHYPSNNRIRDEFPSWLPDWSHKPSVHALTSLGKFSASGNTNAVFRLFSKRRKLMISAIRIDRIVCCGVPIAVPVATSAALMAFLQWRAYLIQEKGNEPADHEAFCRLLCLGSASETTRWTDAEWMDWVYRVFASFLTEKLPSLPLDDELKAYAKEPTMLTDSLRERTWLDYIAFAMAGRRFCITDTNLLGLGSGFLCAGDIICVPLGCSTPVVLRSKGTEWKYVGDVYVDGYMHGRAVEELQRGERQLESFVMS